MKLTRVLILTLAIIVVAGCGGSSSGSGDDATVIATDLKDGSIVLGAQSAPTGPVSFEISNGGSAIHEIEVFAGSQTDLPVDLGVADTTGLTLVDEVEDIIPGGNVNLNLDLEAGDYVIICNLPGHYELGMVTSLTVTE